MKFINLFFLVVFLCAPVAFGVEIKIVAEINKNAITNIDVESRQHLIKFLFDQDIDEKDALETIIRQDLYKEYAKKLGLKISAAELTQHMRQFSGVQLPHGISIVELSNFVEAELFMNRVIEDQVISSIVVTEEQIEKCKKNLKKNKYKIEKITKKNDAEERVNLGWMDEDSLEERVANVTKNLKVGEISKAIELKDGKVQFRLLDTENNLLLLSKFEVKILTGEENGKLIELKVEDLNVKNRNALANARIEDKIRLYYAGKDVQVQILKSNLNEIIKRKLYQQQFIEKEKKLLNQLRENFIVEIVK